MDSDRVVYLAHLAHSIHFDSDPRRWLLRRLSGTTQKKEKLSDGSLTCRHWEFHMAEADQGGLPPPRSAAAHGR